MARFSSQRKNAISCTYRLPSTMNGAVSRPTSTRIERVPPSVITVPAVVAMLNATKITTAGTTRRSRSRRYCLKALPCWKRWMRPWVSGRMSIRPAYKNPGAGPEALLPQQLELAAALERGAIRLAGMDPGQEFHQLWPAGVEAGARRRRLDG